MRSRRENKRKSIVPLLKKHIVENSHVSVESEVSWVKAVKTSPIKEIVLNLKYQRKTEHVEAQNVSNV